MAPLFVLILIAAVLWRQRHRPTATRLSSRRWITVRAPSIPAVHALSGI